MPGYKLFLLNGEEVRDELLCLYCKLVLKDPMQTSITGLRFCKECIDKVQANLGDLDPNDEVWSDLAVKREIANLKVKCENHENGCDWTGMFKELMKHLDTCQFKIIVCKNPGCGEQVLLLNLELHLKDKCLHRQVQCGKKVSCNDLLKVECPHDFLNVHHSESELQSQASPASTHNGVFEWRIPEVRRRIQDAKIGHITSIVSPPFYTGRNGYKMCIRVYLNGDGTGKGTHLSVFFVLMRGEYDSNLSWPFEPSRISFFLINHDNDKLYYRTFTPDTQSSSFKRPVSDMNVAIGCPQFAELSILDNPSYVKDDVMYIRAIVNA